MTWIAFALRFIGLAFEFFGWRKKRAAETQEKEATDAHAKIDRLSDSAVADELHDKWSRPE